jgi:hypothetical protein
MTLHARYVARALVTHNDNIARFHPVIENGINCRILAFADVGGAGKFQNRIDDAGGFNHAAIQCNVAG